jgi:hypothetical protein
MDMRIDAGQLTRMAKKAAGETAGKSEDKLDRQ